MLELHRRKAEPKEISRLSPAPTSSLSHFGCHACLDFPVRPFYIQITSLQDVSVLYTCKDACASLTNSLVV